MGFVSLLEKYRDLVFPIAIIACVVVILVPLPPALMDVLLSANIGIAVIVLLTTIYVRTPLEFSVFPVMLVATALSRLVLNLATTRLILSRSDTEGEAAAGQVIQALGEFVAGDRLEVGIILSMRFLREEIRVVVHHHRISLFSRPSYHENSIHPH